MTGILELGHVGIYVANLEQSKQFFSSVLGLNVTDEDPGVMVFLSARPETEHHELVLMKSSENPSRGNGLQQVSFRCESLADVISLYGRLLEHGVDIEMTMTHGNAIGVYFFDPEGNRLEVYCRLDRTVPQPFLKLLNFDQDIEALRAEVEIFLDENGNRPYLDPQFNYGL